MIFYIYNYPVHPVKKMEIPILLNYKSKIKIAEYNK